MGSSGSRRSRSSPLSSWCGADGTDSWISTGCVCLRNSHRRTCCNSDLCLGCTSVDPCSSRMVWCPGVRRAELTGQAPAGPLVSTRPPGSIAEVRGGNPFDRALGAHRPGTEQRLECLHVERRVGHPAAGQPIELAAADCEPVLG